MYGKKKLFSSLDEFVKSLVKFGNNANIPILGKGQMSIKLKNDSQNFISDVFLCLWSSSQSVKYGIVVRKRL